MSSQIIPLSHSQTILMTGNHMPIGINSYVRYIGKSVRFRHLQGLALKVQFIQNGLAACKVEWDTQPYWLSLKDIERIPLHYIQNTKA